MWSSEVKWTYTVAQGLTVFKWFLHLPFHWFSVSPFGRSIRCTSRWGGLTLVAKETYWKGKDSARSLVLSNCSRERGWQALTVTETERSVPPHRLWSSCACAHPMAPHHTVRPRQDLPYAAQTCIPPATCPDWFSPSTRIWLRNNKLHNLASN